jgi:hypothetical protein
MGQSADTSITETPFRKGRWIAELNGVINSGTIIIPDSAGTGEKFVNNYAFNIIGYKLIKDRYAIGLLIGLSRASSEEFFIHESELFNLGPSFRYYLSNIKHGGAFVQPSLYYSRFFDRNALLDTQSPVDKILNGKGIGLSLGLGYAYVFKDILILEIGFDYSYSWLSGTETDQIINVSTDTNFKRSSFSFSYGVGILIGKQKK